MQVWYISDSMTCIHVHVVHMYYQVVFLGAFQVLTRLDRREQSLTLHDQ